MICFLRKLKKLSKDKPLNGRPTKFTPQHWKLFERLVDSKDLTVTYSNIGILLFNDPEKDNISKVSHNLINAIKLYTDKVLETLIDSVPETGYTYHGPEAVWVVGDLREYFPESFVQNEKNSKPKEQEAKLVNKLSIYHIQQGCFAQLNSGPYFIPRADMYEKLFQAFGDKTDTNRIVFLSGLGGIGKTETACAFANEAVKNGYFKTAIPIFFKPGKDAYRNAIRGTPDFIEEYTSSGTIKIKSYLLSHTDAQTLIIVDNFDSFDESFLSKLIKATSKARILITTRLGENSRIRDFGTVVSIIVDPSQYEFARKIFLKYANACDNMDTKTSENIDSIIQRIGAHTIAAELLGRYIGKSHFLWGSSQTFSNVVDFLSKKVYTALHGKSFTDFSIYKDGQTLTSDSAYGIIKLLFSDVLQNKFTEIERQIIGTIIAQDYSFWNTPDFITSVLCPASSSESFLETQKAIYNLLSFGIIQQDNFGCLPLHPLIKELVTDPSVYSSHQTIAELDNSFLLYLYKALLLKPARLQPDVSDVPIALSVKKANPIKYSLSRPLILWDKIPDDMDYSWIVWHNLVVESALIFKDSNKGFSRLASACKINFSRVVNAIYTNHNGFYSKDQIAEILCQTLCRNPDLNWAEDTPSTSDDSPYFLYIVRGENGSSLFLSHSKTSTDLCIVNGSNYYREGLHPYTSKPKKYTCPVSRFNKVIFYRYEDNSFKDNSEKIVFLFDLYSMLKPEVKFTIHFHYLDNGIKCVESIDSGIITVYQALRLRAPRYTLPTNGKPFSDQDLLKLQTRSK